MKRLVLLLIIAMFIIAGCGGGGGGNTADTDDSGGGGEDTVVDTAAIPENATDKGSIEVGGSVEDEITGPDDIHSYTLAVTEGDALKIVRIGAAGSAFTAPYLFIYDADGTLLSSMDTSKSSRSESLELTAAADGDWTIIVRSIDGKGEEAYTLSVEKTE